MFIPTPHPSDRRDAMPVNSRGHAQSFRDASDITHGLIHHTAVEGTTADQHARYHTNPRKRNDNGDLLGRNWRTVAYGAYVGKDGRRERLLDFEVVGNHSGNAAMNRKSWPIVVEGRYHLYPPTEDVVNSVVAECLWVEAELGRRLIWTWHDVVKPGRQCPGRYFPKQEVLDRIEAHYVALENEGGENDGPNEPVTDEPDYPSEDEGGDADEPPVTEPPADEPYDDRDRFGPGAGAPLGCMAGVALLAVPAGLVAGLLFVAKILLT